MSDAVAKEYTQLNQQSNKIAQRHNHSSDTDVFPEMCSSLLGIVTGRKVIQDRYLLEFSRLVVQMISNAIETLPDSFDALLAAILHYLRYTAWNDTDQNRKTSYIRAHQIASILDVYRTEQRHEELTYQELRANRQNWNLLYYIYQSPGIAFFELQKKPELSHTDLHGSIRQLEEKKLLSNHQSEYDDEPYYMLTRLGRDLCQNLLGPQVPHHVIPNQWSHERVYLLCFILSTQLKSSEDSMPVMTYIRKASMMREADVQRFVSSIKTYVTHVKEHSFDEDLEASIWESLTVQHWLRSAGQSIPKSLRSKVYAMEDKEEDASGRHVRRKEIRIIAEDQMATRENSEDLRVCGRISGY